MVQCNGSVSPTANPMTDSDVSLAKKRLTRELKILVAVQVIALFIATLGRLPWLVLPGIGIPNDPGWDWIQLFSTLGWGVFVVVAIWGGYRLATTPLPSIKMRLYGISVLWIVGCVYLELLSLKLLTLLLFGYCLIPQFLIARWLAKETKDATMTMEWNGTTNLD